MTFTRPCHLPSGKTAQVRGPSHSVNTGRDFGGRWFCLCSSQMSKRAQRGKGPCPGVVSTRAGSGLPPAMGSPHLLNSLPVGSAHRDGHMMSFATDSGL